MVFLRVISNSICIKYRTNYNDQGVKIMVELKHLTTCKVARDGMLRRAIPFQDLVLFDGS